MFEIFVLWRKITLVFLEDYKIELKMTHNNQVFIFVVTLLCADHISGKQGKL